MALKLFKLEYGQYEEQFETYGQIQAEEKMCAQAACMSQQEGLYRAEVVLFQEDKSRIHPQKYHHYWEKVCYAMLNTDTWCVEVYSGHSFLEYAVMFKGGHQTIIDKYKYRRVYNTFKDDPSMKEGLDEYNK